MLLQNLQQLEQIDDLVIAPVADMCPWVGWINDLPINAVLGDAIGVVAIGGGGVGELADHAGRVAREGKREGFPVLEDVTPVALVIQNPRPVRIFRGDGEAIPRAARIAVPPAEGQRQIFPAEPLQVWVSTFDRQRQQAWMVNAFAKLAEKGGVAGGNLFVRMADKGMQVVRIHLVTVIKNAAAHHIEQHIAVMPCVAQRLGGLLQPIGFADNTPQFLGAADNVCVHQFSQLGGLTQQAVEFGHIGRPPVDVGNQIPIPGLPAR